MPAAIHDRCYWTETARPAPAHPPLHGEHDVDVAVVGAGMVGTVAARLLKDRGMTVALVEAGRVGHGVTGRSTAKVTAQHALFLQRIAEEHGTETARIYAEANLKGVELIGELVRQHGLACDFEPADCFVYATTPDGADRLEAERLAAGRAGLAMELVAEPGLPFATTGALRLAGQAQFQPADFVAALAATIPGEGSHVFENSRVDDWDEGRIAAGKATVTARHVIMATHLPLGKVGQFFAHTSPHMHAVMAVPVAAAPAGMYLGIDEPKRSLRRHRGANGETVLILTGPRFRHGDAEAEAEGFAALEAFAHGYFGWTGGGWRWSNEDYTPRDGLPYVGWAGETGRSPLVATGFDAWGLSNGAAAARILADLCAGRDSARAAVFDAGRHSLKGAGKLAKAAAGAAGELAKGKLRKLPGAERAEQLGEGALVEAGGETAGLYRDAAGKLRAVAATCSHMGCPLGWNPVDRTWDCACHGSRFAADGAVVHGPAVAPLEPVALAPELADAG